MAACESDADGDATAATGPESPGQVEALSWHGGVDAIIGEHCSACHSEGGIAPFVLDSYEAVSGMANLALMAMEAGTMPPWMPDDECRNFAHERRMSADEIASFRAWVEAGTPEGAPVEGGGYVAPPPPSFEPTHTAQLPGDYVPKTASEDDYRCFVLDVGDTFESARYLTASQVVPGSPQVHHVLVYALGPELRERVEAADAADEGPGYTCFGGPLPNAVEGGGMAAGAGGLPNQLAGWVPGAVPNIAPEGSATRIDAGSFIVMQIHFSPLGGEPTADKTALQLELTDEVPQMLRLTRPLAILDIPIPAGEARVEHTHDFTNWGSEPIVVRGLTAHMHLLGVQLKASLVKAGGSAEQCMIDIPEWDFSWQQGYRLPEGEEVVIEPGDAVRLTCVYDNSAAHQPVVEGAQVAPRDVDWGEGTLDEMCLLYLDTVAPFEPPESGGASSCEGASECMAACGDEPTVDCVLSCESAGTSCQLCAVQAGVGCGMTGCFLGAQDLTGCLTRCVTETVMLGGATGACMKAVCPDAYAHLDACSGEVLAEEACAEALHGCGL